MEFGASCFRALLVVVVLINRRIASSSSYCEWIPIQIIKMTNYESFGWLVIVGCSIYVSMSTNGVGGKFLQIFYKA